MRIAVYNPRNETLSQGINGFRASIVQELSSVDVQVIEFKDPASQPHDVHLHWDPGIAAASKPFGGLRTIGRPQVVTLWGVLSFTIPAAERHPDLWARLWDRFKNYNKLRTWKRVPGSIDAVITGSQFVRDEAIKHLGLPPDMITPIWAGVDHNLFYPAKNAAAAEPYLLHISNGSPTKNVPRILAAYASLPQPGRPRLKLRIPGYHLKTPIPGVEVIGQHLAVEELVQLYQGAAATVFPSLHEGFGLPIIEAMACGCPVITSNVTACPEVAGDAALLVNPRAVNEIAEAMRRVVTDHTLYADLREKGLARASEFTWRRSAEAHRQLFEKVING